MALFNFPAPRRRLLLFLGLFFRVSGMMIPRLWRLLFPDGAQVHISSGVNLMSFSWSPFIGPDYED